MTKLYSFIFFMALSASLCALPRRAADHLPKVVLPDFEASGTGADEPAYGSVRVVKLSPNFLRHGPGLLGQHAPRRGLLPAFLALGRPGPSASAHGPAAALPHLRNAETKKRQGMEMWQRVMQKSEQPKEVLSLPFNPKDMGTQNCASMPFTQMLTEEGCEPVAIHNKLCFGQCSSMFVPPNGGSEVHSSGASCSRCGPSKTRTVVARMRCGLQVRERRVMLVEECKCETGRELRKMENMVPQL